MHSVLLKTTAKPMERRRHRRVPVSIAGRYMLENKQEFPCQTVDMSPGGLLVAAPVRGEIGERVVFYFEEFGRLEGSIARTTRDGFAVEMNLAPNKRERLADLLTWMINREDDYGESNRRHRRIVPRRQDALMHVQGGSTIPVRIVDVSISGVGLQAAELPPIGARVEIGRRIGKVVRHFKGGLAIEFQRLIPIEEFDEDIEL